MTPVSGHPRPPGTSVGPTRDEGFIEPPKVKITRLLSRRDTLVLVPTETIGGFPRPPSPVVPFRAWAGPRVLTPFWSDGFSGGGSKVPYSFLSKKGTLLSQVDSYPSPVENVPR